MITAVRSGRYVTWNASLFKKLNMQSFQWEEEESEEDDDSEEDFCTDHSGNEAHSQSNGENDGQNGNLTRRYPMRNRKQLNQYGQNFYET